MAPIRQGDGTGVAPKGIKEVRTGAGDVVYSAGRTAIPDSDVYLHDDWGDDKLQNRDGGGTTTTNGVEGVYRPGWTLDDGTPTASNQKIVFDAAEGCLTGVNIALDAERTVWEWRGVDVTSSSDSNDIFSLGLFADSDSRDSVNRLDGNGYQLTIRPSGSLDLQTTPGFNDLISYAFGGSSVIDIRVERTVNGLWELYIDDKKIGEHQDESNTTANYLGFGKRYDANTFYVDSLKTSPKESASLGLWGSWAKNSNNPVLSPSSSGWDSDDVLDPAVVEESGTYHMIYRGDDGSTYRLGHATSTDLVNWTKNSANPILSPGSSGSWDDVHLRGGTDLLIDSNGTYHAFYRGWDGSTYQIGHATSTDWSNWTKDSNNPVLSPSSSGWDSDSISDISVLEYDGSWHAIYQGYNGSTNAFGHATSSDLSNWSKDTSNNPVMEGAKSYDSAGFQSPDIQQVDGQVEMLYNNSTQPRETCYAVSPDLIGWLRDDVNNPVLTDSSSGWDNDQIRATGTIYDGSAWRMLYTGYDGSAFRIGLASVSESITS